MDFEYSDNSSCMHIFRLWVNIDWALTAPLTPPSHLCISRMYMNLLIGKWLCSGSSILLAHFQVVCELVDWTPTVLEHIKSKTQALSQRNNGRVKISLYWLGRTLREYNVLWDGPTLLFYLILSVALFLSLYLIFGLIGSYPIWRLYSILEGHFPFYWYLILWTLL